MKHAVVRAALSTGIHIEGLEPRQLMSGYTLNQVLTEYDAGVKLIAKAQLADEALGQPIKLLATSLSEELGLSNDVDTPFLSQPVPTSSLSSVSSLLSPQNGFVNFTYANPPATDGVLMEVTYQHQFKSSVNLSTSGQTGIGLLDGANNFLGGSLTASSVSVNVSVTFGVNVQNNALGFFVSNGNVVSLASSFSATGKLSGDISIGSLADVTAAVQATMSVTTATVSLTGINIAPGAGSVSGKAAGTLAGSVTFNGNLSVTLPMLPSISWAPVFSGNLSNSGFTANPFDPTKNLNGPSVQALFSEFTSAFSSDAQGFPLFSGLENEINNPLPLINESIAELTGLSGKLPSLPDIGSLLPSQTFALGNGLGSITTNFTAAAIEGLLTGQNENLISWSTGEQNIPLIDEQDDEPLFCLGIPDVASAEIDANFSITASLEYDVGFGIDTNGFYIQAPSGKNGDYTVSLPFNASAGILGQVEVLGFPLAQAGGSIALNVTPYVNFTAPSYSAEAGRIYVNDLTNAFGDDPLTDLFNASAMGVSGAFGGNLSASLNLFVTKVSWNWGVSIPVFNFEKSSAWPSTSSNGKETPPFTISNGVLNYNSSGSSTASGSISQSIKLVENPDKSVSVTYNGTPVQGLTDTPIKLVNIIGDAGGDNVVADPGFGIPMNVNLSAEKASSKSSIQGGAAGNTIIGGAGTDTLVGGAGNDQITAGSGTATIIGGGGGDTLSAGTGNGTDQIYGGSGNSTLIGNAGDDSIFAGGGNDVVYGGSGVFFIDGGTGSNTIYGYADNAAHSVASAGTPVIHAGSGKKDVVYGGDIPTQIFGDGSSATIYGNSGHDTIYGGSGGDNYIRGSTTIGNGGNQIFGGGSGDTLIGGDGSNTIFGGAGNETIYGGDGLESQGGTAPLVGPSNFVTWAPTAEGDGNSSGSNELVAGTGNDVIYGDSTGKNTLQGGIGQDILYAGSAGDNLVAESGLTTLYGGNGNDSLQLQFSPGTSASQNVVLGGPGINTLVINPVNPGPGTLTSAITSTTTSITVANGNDITPAQIASSNGYYILIDGEEMKVTAVSGNTLTVVRGQEGTLASPHSAGASIQPDIHQIDDGYYVYLTTTGTANQYRATLSNLTATNTAGTQVGEIIFTMFTPSSGIGDLQLDAGTANSAVVVDPSVTLNVLLYGGGGNDTLVAGSGNDTLIAGTGSSILEGGSGDDILYAGDLPSDVSSSYVQSQVGSTGGVANTRSSGSTASDTLIGGTGNSDLYAADRGNDVLIGGPATLSNGKWVLGIASATDRDLLDASASSGNNLLILDPGGQGILNAGSGNDTLVADNDGVDVLRGGTGAALMLGGNLQNFETGGTGSDTLVGGVGTDDVLVAGSGNQSLYADPNAQLWAQATTSAASFGVNLPPAANLFATLTPKQLLNSLTTQLDEINAEVQALPNSKLTPVQLQTQASLGDAVSQIGALLQNDGTLLGGTITVDSLIGGSGSDNFYGGAHPTYMDGGSTKASNVTNIFSDYVPGDTVFGGEGNTNELLLFSNASLSVGNVNSGSQLSVTIGNTTDIVAGSYSSAANNVHLNNLQILALQTLAGNDTVNINSSMQNAGFTALDVITGSGTNVVNAVPVMIQENFHGGSGSVTFNVGTETTTGGSFAGDTGFSELNVQASDGFDSFVVRDGKLLIHNGAVTDAVSNLSKIILTGSNDGNPDTFSVDGTIPNVVLVGGTSSNTFSVAASASFSITGSSTATNNLTILCDANSDSVTLDQSGNAIIAYGTINGMATNITSVAINGGTNNETVNLSGLSASIPVTFSASSGTVNFTGGPGPETINCGSGADTIYSGTGMDVINGGAGSFYIVAQGGNDTINGGSASEPSGGTLMIFCGAGNCLVYGATSPTDITGQSGRDTMYGESGADTLYGGASGDNVIIGLPRSGAGNYIVCGGSDNVVKGGHGNNTIFGGGGGDTLYGGDGADLTWNQYNDGLTQPAGDSANNGSNQIIVEGAGGDVVYGDSTGNNEIWGRGNGSSIFGGSGADTLISGGADSLFAGSGNDVLNGRNGYAEMISVDEPGTDTLEGTGGQFQTNVYWKYGDTETGLPPSVLFGNQNFASVMNGGNEMINGDSLISANGLFTVVDNYGEFDIYYSPHGPQSRTFLGSFGSYNTGESHTQLQYTDGNFVTYTGGGQALWAAGQAQVGGPYAIVMQGDGNVVEYNESGQAIWNTLWSEKLPGAYTPPINW